MSDEGLTCAVVRSDGEDIRRIHMNDTMLIHKELPQKRMRRIRNYMMSKDPCGRIPDEVKAYCTYPTLTDNEKELCPSLVWGKPEGPRPVTTIAVDPLPVGCE